MKYSNNSSEDEYKIVDINGKELSTVKYSNKWIDDINKVIVDSLRIPPELINY